MKAGILVIGEFDSVIKSRARRYKLEVINSDEYSLPFEKTLIVESGIRIPWDLLPAAWQFLERWDAAVPLWRYGVTAADRGSQKERDLTKSIVRDLRVLLYSHELLFIRKNASGSALLDCWLSEQKKGADLRLAFLRAFYLVKPKLCALPISWLAEVRAASLADQRLRHPRIGAMKKSSLVRVEVSPGRFVKVHRDDVEKVKAEFEKRL